MCGSRLCSRERVPACYNVIKRRKSLFAVRGMQEFKDIPFGVVIFGLLSGFLFRFAQPARSHVSEFEMIRFWAVGVEGFRV